ncbi:ABC transporter substrate-binding protein [Marinobacter bryozoorum]|uniref:ABC transporter substrate-binding protein n=1 Tax=Marinobacter bryozoorum TaxID=256324 RepID=UPI002003E595|nr:ABC transporter substrate-binding protein [Marinobacter bryozoorum]MCK7543092.1 ABC transporter substrate-binding protein [Marinobacter bryozoorum]
MTRMGMGSCISRKARKVRRAGLLPDWGLAFVLLLVMPLALLAQPLNADVVYLQGSANPTFNLRFTELLQQQLGPETEVRRFSSLQTFEGPPGPVITLGQEALTRVLEASTQRQVLALLIDSDTLAGVAENSGIAISTIWYDPPLLRQALIGRTILPQASRMALLARPGDAGRYEPLLDELADYGIEARVFLVTGDDSLIPTLSRALSFGDFLLATPDDAIYNPRTIKHILLTTYRRNRLVIGPSHAFIRAGVLASSYVPLPDYAARAAQYVREWQRTGNLPEPSYPDSFSIEINRQVARSLNLPLPDREQIVEEVRALLRQSTMEVRP